MNWDNVTTTAYTEYFGVDAPINFVRLRFIAIAQLENRYNFNNISTECQAIAENALIEQIYYLSNVQSIDEVDIVTSISAGNASESYTRTNDKEVSLAVQSLMNSNKCNFNFRGLSSCSNKCMC